MKSQAKSTKQGTLGEISTKEATQAAADLYEGWLAVQAENISAPSQSEGCTAMVNAVPVADGEDVTVAGSLSGKVQ